jgi:hypothetical protein
VKFVDELPSKTFLLPVRGLLMRLVSYIRFFYVTRLADCTLRFLQLSIRLLGLAEIRSVYIIGLSNAACEIEILY